MQQKKMIFPDVLFGISKAMRPKYYYMKKRVEFRPGKIVDSHRIHFRISRRK